MWRPTPRYRNEQQYETFTFLPEGFTILQFFVIISTLITLTALLYFSFNVKTKTTIDLLNLNNLKNVEMLKRQKLIENLEDVAEHENVKIVKKENEEEEFIFSKKPIRQQQPKQQHRKVKKNNFYSYNIKDSELLCPLNSGTIYCQKNNAWAFPGHVELPQKFEQNVKFKGSMCNAKCVDQQISLLSGICVCQSVPALF